jgi:uncharacterized protein (DUF1800 family)
MLAHMVPLRVTRWLALAALLLVSCSRGVRQDVTPPLAAQAAQGAAEEAARRDPQAGAPLSLAEQVDHALSRATFGPRPGDRARVARLGVVAFLEEQLHPERIADDALEARVRSRYKVVDASPAELMKELLARQEQRKEQKRQQLASAGSMLEAMVPEEPKPEDKPKAEQPGPGGPFVGELARARLLRAVASERQLQEVMVDFWFNHFNVFGGKDRIRALLPSYERDAIRAHALGRFADLLEATAHHPAMLVYLDNWRSSSPEGPPRYRRVEAQRPAWRRPSPERVEKRRRARGGRGLNENYARELLELHTLGVDAGYTQEDVTEVARCFTGWTVSNMRDDPQYLFRRAWHDSGEKRVLGKIVEAGGGESDGQAILELLAHHPATARFIAGKLVRRFVDDDPPPLLVERVAETFEKTDGDIRSMLRAIFAAPEFWSRRALRAKIRSPLELVAGSVRALGGAVDDAMGLSRAVERIGEPLYGAQPPTGWGDTASAWVSPGALLARINFALQLADGKIDGVQVDLAPLAAEAPDAEKLLARAQALLGAGELSQRTRDYVLDKLREVPPERAARRPEQLASRAVGLLLGAPELQRR